MGIQAKVYLVGTGPGDPDLLTVKALRLLQTAEVIVYDRLVSDEILQQIPSGVTRIFAGKQTGNHTLKQHEINQLLVSLADKARTIVRLKGGDPFVFGRGSEEALELVKHGIPFEVVPGVTAASAVTTYAGIPLTHRGLSQGVNIITGHCQNDLPLDADWSKLADENKTLVIYMGLANIGAICQHLIDAGLSRATPAAAIENGATINQRRLISNLQSLADDTQRAEMKAPVLFVIGKVVKLSDQLNWFAQEYANEPSTAGMMQHG